MVLDLGEVGDEEIDGLHHVLGRLLLLLLLLLVFPLLRCSGVQDMVQYIGFGVQDMVQDMVKYTWLGFRTWFSI